MCAPQNSPLALVSLACSIGLCVYVLLPKRGFLFSINASAMYGRLFDCVDDDEVRRRLAYWLEEFWNVNQGKIETLDRYYIAATSTLVLQLTLWAWALLANIS